MRTKLSVLVLGLLLGRAPPEVGVPEAGREHRGAGAPSPALPQPEVPRALKHPCQVITFIQVPCDTGTATCEYTYWECPPAVNLLRA
ncbi:hypothetical protein SAMN05444354_11841 [Stigmatella aurantiaca]|uniref:Uncharacterized protein n=1 Tax=Stigmatella aurantiaca TaxID=41 RepID=A0A1H7Z2R9_STIAU|nr:hypothetical protein [Stigmatella aurantiaca]SEM52491.1 hypothetical protein SAMN05444354_11841 [Stigmatella aurantiaca]